MDYVMYIVFCNSNDHWLQATLLSKMITTIVLHLISLDAALKRIQSYLCLPVCLPNQIASHIPYHSSPLDQETSFLDKRNLVSQKSQVCAHNAGK